MYVKPNNTKEYQKENNFKSIVTKELNKEWNDNEIPCFIDLKFKISQE